ncbi:exo-beta-N-acetylmuramidase NamZ domain-containing protein [Brevibacillus laterosporus]|uniref:exo-beta-N-acetylmuramidase NamZ domain-containing protein n=1 Tax=Brevibacillus laterosporus TaxID=1465 RepID=UPI001F4C6DDF|nr:exo-beta-N-acetylmuramidase NamZ domain-containing protein [Brevibacillus laterosporus]
MEVGSQNMRALRLQGRSIGVLACLLLWVSFFHGSSSILADETKEKHVLAGIDVLLSHPELLHGKKIGLITNQTGVTKDLVTDLDALQQKGLNVVALYGPEHGIWGVKQDGEPTVFPSVSPQLKQHSIPVFELYQKKPEQIATLFAGTDILLFDLQDVGVRYYTYASTLAYVLEAAKLADKPVMVLDRPNPLGGVRIEGPLLEEGWSSFIGMMPIPLRHAMTMGELALFYNEEVMPNKRGGKADLRVIRMQGWKREMTWDQTGLLWVAPSPNLPTVESAWLYAATGLLEGTNLSEGRGTTHPFEWVGAPFIHAHRLRADLVGAHLPGITIREAHMEPMYGKYKGQAIHGVQLYVTDRTAYHSTLTGLTLLQLIKKRYPQHFKWRDDGWIHYMAGTRSLQEAVDQQTQTLQAHNPQQMIQQWRAALQPFVKVRQKYLLYRERGSGKRGEGMRDEVNQAIEQAIKDKIIPGAVVAIVTSGKRKIEQAYGHAYLYQNKAGKLAEMPIKMTETHLFDIASLTKLFTAVSIMQLAEKQMLQLDKPVAAYLPAFACKGKQDITIRQLLTHTSGLAPTMRLYRIPGDREQRMKAVLMLGLKNHPGEKMVYSDLNYIVLGYLIEQLTGKRLDQYMQENLFQPLGMKHTGFCPKVHRQKIVATEQQPWTKRDIIWGSVHDEKAWALDGVAGHAGLFSNADDLVRFATMILHNGKARGKRILKAESVQEMLANQLSDTCPKQMGLGFERNQAWYMGHGFVTPSVGHTGFTGTSLLINQQQQSIVLLLTNRVHPTREKPSLNALRQKIATLAAIEGE